MDSQCCRMVSHDGYDVAPCKASAKRMSSCPCRPAAVIDNNRLLRVPQVSYFAEYGHPMISGGQVYKMILLNLVWEEHHTIFYEGVVASPKLRRGHFVFRYSHTVTSKSQYSLDPPSL